MKLKMLLIVTVATSLFYGCSNTFTSDDTSSDTAQARSADVVAQAESELDVKYHNADTESMYEFTYKMKDYPYYILHAFYYPNDNRFDCECIIDSTYVSSQNINQQIIHFDVDRMTEATEFMYDICINYIIHHNLSNVIISSDSVFWNTTTPIAHYNNVISSISRSGTIESTKNN